MRDRLLSRLFDHNMYLVIITLLLSACMTRGQPAKCDQKPPQATSDTPAEDNGYYRLRILTSAASDDNTNNTATYTPHQTYILRISSDDNKRTFRSFMITAEDPELDQSNFQFGTQHYDVGSLKTLSPDTNSRYSERCFNSVENSDYTDKTMVEVHWVSPKQSDRKHQMVRIRAMVAENDEVWYEGPNLTVVLHKNDNKSKDSPPEAIEECTLCSEARYEVIFYGLWSRVAHPQQYPSKPDENGYSHMIGASHAYDYALWELGSEASPGLSALLDSANTTKLEREIIDSMSEEGGTRTMIRGKKRHHPHMSEPSHSLFRVDRIHHLFSIVVGMRPSPDWFLGTSKFELCRNELGWLEEHTLLLYPWDAGTTEGISYESEKSQTQPINKIDRVEVGSFNRESPFYQTNLDDLKPFARLVVRLLDVYHFPEEECGEGAKGTPEIADEGDGLCV